MTDEEVKSWNGERIGLEIAILLIAFFSAVSIFAYTMR